MYIYVGILCEENRFYMVKIRVLLLMVSSLGPTYPPTFISQGGYSSIHFHIAGNATQYVDLGRIEMYARIRIENVDGSAFAEEHSAFPIDQIFHTMWSSADIS